jgi:hypothetical protein
MAPNRTRSSEAFNIGCVRAEEIVQAFPVVNIDSPALDAVRLIPDAHWCTLVHRCTLLRSVILDGSPMHPRCRLVTAFDAGRVWMSDRSVAGLGGHPGCGTVDRAMRR